MIEITAFWGGERVGREWKVGWFGESDLMGGGGGGRAEGGGEVLGVG